MVAEQSTKSVRCGESVLALKPVEHIRRGRGDDLVLGVEEVEHLGDRGEVWFQPHALSPREAQHDLAPVGGTTWVV